MTILIYVCHRGNGLMRTTVLARNGGLSQQTFCLKIVAVQKVTILYTKTQQRRKDVGNHLHY